MSDVQECPACGAVGGNPSYIGAVRFQSFSYRYLECRICGSLYADPMPGQEILERIYDPRYAATHYAQDLNGDSSSGELLRETHEALGSLSARKPRARLLDIGCGAGKFLVLAQAAGFHPEGHELVPASAEVAERATGLRVHAGPLVSLAPVYEAIHMADVLEHSPRPLELLRDAVSLLAPDGVMLLRGPLENQINLFQRLMSARRRVHALLRELPPAEMPPHHVSLFALAGWRALMDRASLVPLWERVYEIHWPAPERFAPTVVSAAKAASLAFTATSWGRRLACGNRVVSLLRTRGSDYMPAARDSSSAT